MRTHRPDIPLLYSPDEPFQVGGCKLLAHGHDLTIVASGYMVHQARKALDQLAAQGVQCTLIDAYSFPLQPEPILQAARAAGGKILTLEDNYGGALGSAIAEVAAASGQNLVVHAMTCRRIPKSAITPDEVLALVGLDLADVVRQARALLDQQT
jgi:transketolase